MFFARIPKADEMIYPGTTTCYDIVRPSVWVMSVPVIFQASSYSQVGVFFWYTQTLRAVKPFFLSVRFPMLCFLIDQKVLTSISTHVYNVSV